MMIFEMDLRDAREDGVFDGQVVTAESLRQYLQSLDADFDEGDPCADLDAYLVEWAARYNSEK